MKIIQFIDSMYTGGAETSVCNTALEMKRQNPDVMVLCFSVRRKTANEKRLDENGVRTIYLGDECLRLLHLECLHDTVMRYIPMLIMLIPVFRRTIKKEQPDILHMHLDALLFYPFIPASIRKSLHTFWTMHSTPEKILTGGLLPAIRKRVLKRNKEIRIFSLNEEGIRGLVRLKVNNDSSIIRNGIDMRRFKNREISGLRSELGIPEDAFIIGHVGRFGDGEAIKNQAFIVRVFERILKKRSDAYLLLIGGGKPSDRLIADVGNAGKDHVVVLSDRADIPELMGIMDVFVMPSVYEGFPVTLIEAQASGLRCIVSDAVTRETALSDRICYLPLDEEKWEKEIPDPEGSEQKRGELADYDIEVVVKKLLGMYCDADIKE